MKVAENPFMSDHLSIEIADFNNLNPAIQPLPSMTTNKKREYLNIENERRHQFLTYVFFKDSKSHLGVNPKYVDEDS